MALELSNKRWRVAFGGGGTGRQVSLPAGALSKLAEPVAKDKERLGMPPPARVVSCYEAGRDGWSVVRMPSIEEEDARRPHRELERLKREGLAHRVRMQSLLKPGIKLESLKLALEQPAAPSLLKMA